MKLALFQTRVKIAGLMVFLLLVLGIAVFAGNKTFQYLSKASTCLASKVAVTQVSANSAVVSWETADVTQGRVEYGTNSANLTFSVPEATSGKIHNIPLTLLTPNTVYYYLVVVGKNRCDSSGQVCAKTCVPASFTTASIAPPSQVVATLPPPTTNPSPLTTVPSPTTVPIASPTGSVFTLAFCQQVSANLGASQEATRWATLKQYDIDGNGVINGVDIIKCQRGRR